MEKDKIIEMTKEGYSSSEIANELHIAVETLQAFARISGIKLDQSERRRLNARASFTEKVGIDNRATRTNKVTLEQVKELHDKGMTQRQIADEFKVSPTTISKYIRRLGVPKKNCGVRKKQLSESEFKKRYGSFKPEPEEVRRLYTEEGMTRDMLAYYYGVSQGSIDLFMVTHGIRLTPEQRKLRKGLFKTPDEFVEAVKKYKTAKAVADHFGFGVPTAYYHANNFGVQFESRKVEMTERLTDLAFEYMESELNLKKFAEENNVRYQSLYNIMRRIGIDVRSKKFVEDLVHN